ncbi:unnamed protein product [Chrysoparadoxa australica]
MGKAEDEKFDGLYLSLAQQCHGIEPMMESLFGFLRRKTDFFTGTSEAQCEEVVLKALRKEAEVAKRDKIKKERQEKERHEKAAKKALEKAEKVAEQAEKAAAKVRDGVVSVSDDGSFDIAAAPSTTTPPVTVSALHLTSFLTCNASILFTWVCATGPMEVPGGTSKAKDAGADDEDDEKRKLDHSPGNGGKTDRYVWVQQLADVNISIPVPEGIKARDLSIVIGKSKLKVAIKGQPPIIDGEFYKGVIVDDSFWTLEANQDGKEIAIALQKENQMEWWKCAIKGDPEIDTTKVQPENSKLADLDGETRQTVEKMMFDQRQKAMGLPSSEEMKKQEMLSKFMEQHPEMDFSNVKMS